MSLKNRIKNDLWRVNYIVPFVKKHQFDEKGKVDMIKKVLSAYKTIKVVSSKPRSVGNDTKEILSTLELPEHLDDGLVYFIDTTKTIAVPGNILSNFTLDYNKIIHGSFENLVSKAAGNDNYGKETSLVAEGVRALRNRILEKLSTESRFYDYFTNLLDKPAEHFEEALQRILFFNQIMWQTRHRLNGLGRLDYFLGDLYEKDVASGNLTKDTASDMVYSFMSKLSQFPEYKSDALEGDIGQIIILGGVDEHGKYFHNDLTEIFLMQQAKLKKPDPKTLLRVSVKTPRELMSVAVECLKSKTGSPLFSNDDVVIPALEDFGIPEADARMYCTSACWEPYIVGKSLDQNNIAVFDFFKALDTVLGNGYQTYDALVNAYIAENNKNFQDFVNGLDEIKWARDPLVSLFMEGCSVKRRDVSEGGTKYNNYGITTVALSNVVDSLENIKELVFKEKKYTLEELNEERITDFKNHEDTYKYFQSSEKHFGHDTEETIRLANMICSNLSNIAKSFKNKLGGTVKFGLSSPGYNILSKMANADFSGRKARMPYNTHISCTDAAYTEVVNFASQLNYKDQRFNGNVVDYFMSPSFLNSNKDKFVSFMLLAVKQGFFQMQMNIMDSKTLIDAKKNPEKYPGLIVRVWGFSAYFNDLPESYKDLLIKRAQAAESVA